MVRTKTKKNISKKPRFIFTFFVIFILSIPAVLALTKPGFFPTHDYIYIARIQQMFVALSDGQFPVRWISGFRYGEPLFNFYAPLPYYIGALVHALGFTYLGSAKVLFALSLVFSGFSMYLLSKELYGKKSIAILTSVFYLYAPYRSVDIYVRGAVSESWAFVFFPLIILYTYKFANKNLAKYGVLLSLSLAGLFYTHNVTTVMFLPFYLLFGAFMVFTKKELGLIPKFAGYSLLGVAIAASYLLPAFFEKTYIQTKFVTEGYFDFRAHYVAIRQFFDTFWGYGASLWGPKDDLSLQLGVVHWVFIFFALVALGFALKRSGIRNIKSKDRIIYFFLILFILSLFLQHNRSTFIWLNFEVLQYVQFPWRFMGISVFFASLIGGYAVSKLTKRQSLIALLISLVVIIYNYQYFKPESYYLDSIDEHYVGDEVLAKDHKLPRDYLPVWVKRTFDTDTFLPISNSKIEINDYVRKSDSVTFKVSTQTDANITIPVTYFPGWVIYIDDKGSELFGTDEQGRIIIKVPEGEHEVEIRFTNTSLRLLADLLTFTAILASVYIFRKREKYIEKIN